MGRIDIHIIPILVAGVVGDFMIGGAAGLLFGLAVVAVLCQGRVVCHAFLDLRDARDRTVYILHNELLILGVAGALCLVEYVT